MIDSSCIKRVPQVLGEDVKRFSVFQLLEQVRYPQFDLLYIFYKTVAKLLHTFIIIFHQTKEGNNVYTGY